MKNFKKILNVLIIMVIIILMNYGTVFADPNSSKGFLSYTDEQAEEERQELIKAQENSNTIAEVKSTNNYLKELSVKGYKITPDFDKQTVNYELKKEVKADTIVIEAKADDDKATITGIGENPLNDGENQIKIDVTAENGTVRSYYIKAVKKASKTTEAKEEEKENKEENKENVQKEKNNIAVIILCVIIIIFILLVIIKKIRHK